MYYRAASADCMAETTHLPGYWPLVSFVSEMYVQDCVHCNGNRTRPRKLWGSPLFSVGGGRRREEAFFMISIYLYCQTFMILRVCLSRNARRATGGEILEWQDAY